MSKNRAGKNELCTATYSAYQVGDSVTLLATGVHPSSGYHVFLETSVITAFPPEYRLWHIAPGGIVTPAQTPFAVSTGLVAAEPLRAITVYDAGGENTVRVEQVEAPICDG